MATQARLQGIVQNIIDEGWLTPRSTSAAVKKAYRQVCYRERVLDAYTEKIRPWGSGPNESYTDFEREIMQRWWGRYDIPPDEWPDAYLPEERQLAADIGVNPANLGGALWLQSQDGMWEQWRAIVEGRSPTSSLYFCDLAFFVRAAREMGAARVKKYTRAKTWAQTKKLGDMLECEIDDSLALHAVLVNYWWHHDEWSRVIHETGGRNVARVLERMPDATPHAVWVALRVPEARESEYMLEMARHIGPVWDAIPDDAIRRIIRETPWRGVIPEYRVRLISGESPQALAASLWEPLDGPTAHRWIIETGGLVAPDMFYAVQVAGIPAAEYERLIGYRGRAEKIVIDWYARKRTSPKVTRERPWRLPDGTGITVALTAVLDEVRPEHLVNGVATDPDHVFMAIMNTHTRAPVAHRMPTGNRTMQALREAAWRSTPFPAWPERIPVPGITQVRSWDRLVDIGNREGHCAGQYAPRCAQGEAFMFEVNLDGRFSLFQITPTGVIVQHHAKANSKPIESHRRAVAEWLQYNGNLTTS